METQWTSLANGYPPSVAAYIPQDICDLVVDIIMKQLLAARRRRTFAFRALEDLELHREELKCRATLAAGARISKAWHSPFQYHLSQHIWLSSELQFARLASHAYTADPSLVREITIDPSGQSICNAASYACHCVVGVMGQFTSAAKLSLCGVAWRTHTYCVRQDFFVMCQHITCLSLVWVHFQSSAHFYNLLEALPNLRTLECSHVMADNDDENLAVMGCCTKLRELRVLDVDGNISAFLSGVDENLGIPSVETISMALHIDYMERNSTGWARYRMLLPAYSESLRELKLMLHIEEESFRSALMLPGGLGGCTNLRKITMVLRVPPVPRFYSCFTSLLSTVSSTQVTDISISFRPMAHPQDDVVTKRLAKFLNLRPTLRDMDRVLMHDRFKNIHQQGVRIELVTAPSELGTIIDDSLKSRGGWEASVRQCMTQIDAAGRLHCVRRIVDPLDLHIY